MENNNEMRVTKRNGELEDVSFDKILNRIKKLGNEVNIQINYSSLAMKVIDQLYDRIETTKIDELASEQCASLLTHNCDYGVLAARIVISNHQKNTNSIFSEVVSQLYYFKDLHGIHKPIVSKTMYMYTVFYKNEINAMTCL